MEVEKEPKIFKTSAKQLGYKRKYVLTHKEKVKESFKLYYQANHDKILAQCREYYERTKDKKQAYYLKMKALKQQQKQQNNMTEPV